MIKKVVMACALLAAAAGACAQSSADDNDRRWLVRLREIHIQSANKDTTGLHLSVQNKWVTAGDVTYFFTPNLAVDATLASAPINLAVKSFFGVPIGTLTALPPMVMAQYHFTGLGRLKPYVGIGLNYTRILSTDLLWGFADISRKSFGPVVQAGVDYEVEKNIYLNLDVKKVSIRNKVYFGDVKIGTFKLDPTLVGVGLGYRF